MAQRIERAVIDLIGGAVALDEAIASYKSALDAFALTVDQAPPIAHELVVLLVTRFGGQYEIVEPPEPEPEPEPEPIPNIPASFPLSNRQLRLGLIRNGIGLSAVAAVIAAIPDAVARDEATVWWEYTEVIQWGHPMTQTLIALMGIPISNASAMWMAAKDYAA